MLQPSPTWQNWEHSWTFLLRRLTPEITKIICLHVLLSLALFTLILGVFLLVHHLCGIHHAPLLHERCHHSQRAHRILSYCCPQCLPLLYSRPCGAPSMAGQCLTICLAMCLPRAVSFTLCGNCWSLPCLLRRILANCLWLCMCLWVRLCMIIKS